MFKHIIAVVVTLARLAVGKGVYFYEKKSLFKLSWQKAGAKGAAAAKAKGPDDVEACKTLHGKFHVKMKALAASA